MYPRLLINKENFRKNLATTRGLLDGKGISFMLVTKGFCALPELCAAAEPYVDYFADSRTANLRKLAGLGTSKPKVLLRVPMPSEAGLAVEYADISLNTEYAAAAALDEAAARRGLKHRIVMMVDLGDLREGYFTCADMLADARRIETLKNVEITGIGVNLSCYGGVIPTKAVLERLTEWAARLEEQIGRRLTLVSGGNSSSLPLVINGEMPGGVNNLRLGESVLCGRDPATGVDFPRMNGEVFKLECEIVELKEKPSVPLGETGYNAYGERPDIVDRGWRKRAILAVGRQDVAPDCVSPEDSAVIVLGASSDHLITDVSDAKQTYAVGDIMTMRMAYPAILKACTSPYIEKVFI